MIQNKIAYITYLISWQVLLLVQWEPVVKKVAYVAPDKKSVTEMKFLI